MQNLGTQTEASQILMLFSSQKNVQETESRLLFSDKSIHCSGHC